MKHFQVWLNRFQSVIVKADSREQLEDQIERLKFDEEWPNATVGLEVTIFNKIPTKTEIAEQAR